MAKENETQTNVQGEKNKKKSGYTAEDIYVLEGLDPVRQRPGMYIGSTGIDGLHHLIWEVVDNSVTYKTPVLIKQKNRAVIRKIGELSDEFFAKNSDLVEKSPNGEAEVLKNGFDLQALSFNPYNLTMAFQPISALIRHKVNSEIYKITLQNGREVEITPYHSLFTFSNGFVKPIRGDDLRVGSFVVVPQKWPEFNDDKKQINLIDEFLLLTQDKTKPINLYGLSSLLRKNTELALEIKASIPQYNGKRHRANLWQDYLRDGYLPFNLIRCLDKNNLAIIKQAKPLLGNKRSDNWKIPAYLDVNRELAELLGIFAAEGCIVKNKALNRVVFGLGSSEKDLINYVCYLIEKCFSFKTEPHYSHETAVNIAINSYLISLIFENVFKTGKNSANKRIPEIVFNQNEYFKQRYLIAYLSGDGYPTKKWQSYLFANLAPSAEEKRKFSFAGKSKELISDFSYLLSSLGKSYCFQEIKRNQKQRLITLTYKGKQKTMPLNCALQSYKVDFYWNSKASYMKRICFNDVVKEQWSYCGNYTSVDSGISSDKALQLACEKKISLHEGALRFLRSDLGILKVRKIEKIKYTKPWVYDFSVPFGENFIGGTSPICLHNSLDEAMGGYCDAIEVILQKDGSVKCTDNGRGIPVETHKKTGKSALETVMTTLHAGGKFGSGAYKVSGGLHGVGVSVVCALSKHMKSEICRDGFKWMQEFAYGKPVGKLKKLEACKQTGTFQTFIPDETIFKNGVLFDKKRILRHLRQQAYLTPQVKINVRDEREEPGFDYNFYFEGGIKSYVQYLLGGMEKKNDNIFYCKNTKEDILVEVALVYGKEEIECLEESFANNINTGEGGMHLTGFRTALTRVINDYARKNGFIKEKEENLTGNDVREGLVAVVSIKIKEPQFEGQTKAKLGNPEAKTAVESVFGEAFAEFLEKNPPDARAIVEGCMLSARARKAAKAARTTVLRKGILEGLALPGKLADCSTKQPEESELYLVEGDSAGGCFSGETKVDLLDGRSLSFKELENEQKEGKKNYCFSIQEDGSIGVGLIKNTWKTKSNVEVIRVVLDNNQEIICTPDHKFMLRDGSYQEARNLLKTDSLMPLNRKITKKGGLITIDGYEMTLCPKRQKWIFTHLLVDRYNLTKKKYFKKGNSVVHHLDYNKLNNSPDNLSRMDKMEHLYFHATVARDNLSKPETLEKIRQAHQTKEYREKIKKTMSQPAIKEMLSQRAKKQWKSKEYKKYMVEKFLDFYRNNSAYREKNNKLLNNAQKEYWANTDNRMKQAERVKKYFENNPEHRTKYSQRAQKQWKNKGLLEWRSETTKKQWTKTFRQKRKIAYDKTYLSCSLGLLREVFDNFGAVSRDNYKELRLRKKAKNALKYETLLERFFEDNESKLIEAVANYNHKIKKIEAIQQRRDVYDLEVEGTHNFALSAGVFVHNSSKMARDRRFQAILPLRGKVLNVERARLDKILANNEIKNLVIALGTAIAQDFDIKRLRYHRIVIMSDADVDGSHIRTLLLTLFYRYFREIIENGYLYIAQPPLYKVQSGKRMEYAYTDEDKNEIILDFTKNKALKGKGNTAKDQTEEQTQAKQEQQDVSLLDESEIGAEAKKTNINVQRYKGLGEMNPEELWETTMNPKNRILLQVTLEDAKQADQVFDTLMGSDVAPRKKFIQTHAKKVKNLDI